MLMAFLSKLEYNTHLEAAAFFFLAMLYIYLRRKYYTQNFVNKTFRRLVFCQLLAILLDIAAAVGASFAKYIPIWLNIALNTLYFASTGFLFYTLHLFLISFGLKKKLGTALLVFSKTVLIMFLLLLSLNIPFGFLFTFKDGHYERGPMNFLFILIPLIFFAECCHTFVLIRKRVSKLVFFVLLTLLVMSVVGPILQFTLFHKTLLSNFFSLFSMILCLFALVSPDYAELTKKQAELVELQQHLEEKAAAESEKIHRSDKKKEALSEQIINALAETIDAGDPNRVKHSENVAEMSRQIAYKMALPKNEAQNIYYTAILHDIGIIGVPEEVASKQGKLDPEEYEQMKKHSEIGERILSTITEMPDMAKSVRSHHERYDGSGYPDGLSGKDIPLAARIIAVADAYDAMVHERSYKNKLTASEAKQELSKHSGKQFDPEVVAAALEII